MPQNLLLPKLPEPRYHWIGRGILYTILMISATVDAYMFKSTHVCNKHLVMTTMVGLAMAAPLLMLEAISHALDRTYEFLMGREDDARVESRSWTGYVCYACCVIVASTQVGEAYYRDLLKGNCTRIYPPEYTNNSQSSLDCMELIEYFALGLYKMVLKDNNCEQ